MTLFSNKNRNNDSPSLYSESTYSFLDRVSGYFWSQIRDVLELWISRWPERDRRDLEGRFRSGDSRAFSSALQELYCHEMLLSLGYAVEIHPSVSGTRRRPDFLATSEGSEFYLEARTVLAPLDQSEIGNHEGVIYDALNRLNSPNFFLSVAIESHSPISVGVSGLRRRLQDWLNALDPDEVIQNYESGREEYPEIRWSKDEWTFRILSLIHI